MSIAVDALAEQNGMPTHIYTDPYQNECLVPAEYLSHAAKDSTHRMAVELEFPSR